MTFKEINTRSIKKSSKPFWVKVTMLSMMTFFIAMLNLAIYFNSDISLDDMTNSNSDQTEYAENSDNIYPFFIQH